jgi:hypothetical protein
MVIEEEEARLAAAQLRLGFLQRAPEIRRHQSRITPSTYGFHAIELHERDAPAIEVEQELMPRLILVFGFGR